MPQHNFSARHLCRIRHQHYRPRNRKRNPTNTKNHKRDPRNLQPLHPRRHIAQTIRNIHNNTRPLPKNIHAQTNTKPRRRRLLLILLHPQPQRFRKNRKKHTNQTNKSQRHNRNKLRLSRHGLRQNNILRQKHGTRRTQKPLSKILVNPLRNRKNI